MNAVHDEQQPISARTAARTRGTWAAACEAFPKAQVQIADHLLTVTYPMVKDPKLLMSVIEHCRRELTGISDTATCGKLAGTTS